MCYEKKCSQNFEEIQGQYLRRSPFMENSTVALKLTPSSIFAWKFFQNVVLFPKRNSTFRIAHFSCYIRVLVQIITMKLPRLHSSFGTRKISETWDDWSRTQTLKFLLCSRNEFNQVILMVEYSFMIQGIVSWNPISVTLNSCNTQRMVSRFKDSKKDTR